MKTTTPFWRKPSVWIVLILLTAAGYGAYRYFSKPKPAAPIVTEAASKREITRAISLSGRVQPSATVDVGTQASGQVEVLHVVLGQRVKKGDLLVTLDASIARNDVAQAQATFDQQSAALDSRRIDLETARREFATQERLLAGDAATGKEVNDAQSNLRKLELEIRGQKANLDKTTADLAKVKFRLSQAQIFAPRDGEVLSLAVQQGQTIIATQTTPTLLTLASLDTAVINAQISEADVLRVKVGQTAELSSAADRNNKLAATVKRIQPPSSNRDARTTNSGRSDGAVFYVAVLEVDNRDGKLLSEMTVQVDLKVGGVKDAVTIPLTAVGERASDGTFTVKVQIDGKLTERKVKLGINDSKFVEVLSGITAGELVVVQAAEDAEAKKPKYD